MAESAQTDRYTAFLKLIVLEDVPRPFVVQAEVRCTGKRPWTFGKTFAKLPFAMQAYTRCKETATAKMQYDNS